MQNKKSEKDRKSPFFREHGFVVSAASDWSLELATYPMSVIMATGMTGESFSIFFIMSKRHHILLKTCLVIMSM